VAGEHGAGVPGCEAGDLNPIAPPAP
jgi:hypothetical protein